MSDSGTPAERAGQGTSTTAPASENTGRAASPASPLPAEAQAGAGSSAPQTNSAAPTSPSTAPPPVRANEETESARSSAGESGTLHAQALALYEQKLTRPQIAVELVRRGADAESVQVVLNTLPGTPQPHALPEVNFDQSVNPLSPQLLSLMDMGLKGDRLTVALYWLTFGGVLAAFITIVLMVGETDFLTSTSGAWAAFAMRALPWAGYPLAAFAVFRGLALMFRRWL